VVRMLSSLMLIRSFPEAAHPINIFALTYSFISIVMLKFPSVILNTISIFTNERLLRIVELMDQLA
jgi:hypothetical protein